MVFIPVVRGGVQEGAVARIVKKEAERVLDELLVGRLFGVGMVGKNDLCVALSRLGVSLR